MSVSLDKELLEVRKGNIRACWRDLTGVQQAAQHLRHLYVDEMRRMHALPRVERSNCNAVRSVGPQYQLDGNRRIKNNQRASRSSRNT